MLKKIIAALCILLMFSGCEADSYKAFLSIESGTKTSWNQKHDYLEGTKSHVLYLGKEPKEMEIDVVTEEGKIDIKFTDIKGNEILFLENAETGKYEFSAEGKVKIRIYCREHQGSISVYKKDS